MNWSVLLGILAGVCLAEMVAFIALYAGRSAWRSRPEGKALMGLFAILGSIFAMFLLGRIVGGLGLPTWCVAFAVFALVLAVWLVLLVRAQRVSPLRRRKMSTPYPTTPKIETKVKTAAVATYLALVALVAVLQHVSDLNLITFLPDWLETIAGPLLPTAITLLAGYAAKHTPRPDLAPAQR